MQLDHTLYNTSSTNLLGQQDIDFRSPEISAMMDPHEYDVTFDVVAGLLLSPTAQVRELPTVSATRLIRTNAAGEATRELAVALQELLEARTAVAALMDDIDRCDQVDERRKRGKASTGTASSELARLIDDAKAAAERLSAAVGPTEVSVQQHKRRSDSRLTVRVDALRWHLFPAGSEGAHMPSEAFLEAAVQNVAYKHERQANNEGRLQFAVHRMHLHDSTLASGGQLLELAQQGGTAKEPLVRVTISQRPSQPGARHEYDHIEVGVLPLSLHLTEETAHAIQEYFFPGSEKELPPQAKPQQPLSEDPAGPQDAPSTPQRTHRRGRSLGGGASADAMAEAASAAPPSMTDAQALGPKSGTKNSSREFHCKYFRVNQAQLVVRYKGSPMSFKQTLVLDKRVIESFTGRWRDLYKRLKRGIIWSVLKSVTGLQAHKAAKGLAPPDEEVTADLAAAAATPERASPAPQRKIGGLRGFFHGSSKEGGSRRGSASSEAASLPVTIAEEPSAEATSGEPEADDNGGGGLLRTASSLERHDAKVRLLFGSKR